MRVRRLVRACVALLATAALTTGLALPLAHGDDLDDQKSRINKQISQTKRELNESSADLNKKVAALEASKIKLSDAQARLETTRAELAKAEQRDAEMAAKLLEAQRQLAAAKQAVADGVVRLDTQRAKVGAVVQAQWQQKTNLLPVAVLAQSGSTRDFQTRLQWSSTMFDASESKIKELEEAQRQLNAKRQQQSTLEQTVAEQRAAAAENLKLKQRLQEQAAQQAAEVASLVAANTSAQQAAAAVVAQEEAEYAQLTSERAKVEQRIKERIEAQKRAEAKRVAAEKKAAREQAARERASQRKASTSRANGRSNSNTNSNSGSGSGGSSASSAHHGFVFPVSGPITSPYGMRQHPVTGVYKLHDGTDFGAGCGTPIRAAYSGTVTERYFNVAWGNRLMVDHGRVDGRYVSTAYNHATSYVVGVGQRVSKGQVIGYVGTTGWSTGCHLHLNLYLNGSVSNPMSWY